MMSNRIEGEILVCEEGLSLWGGVDPETGIIRDVLHPQHGETLAGRIVFMPTSRGSSSGGGILLGPALSGNAPLAFVFKKPESILNLGAVIAERMFGLKIPMLQLNHSDYAALSNASHAVIDNHYIEAGPSRVSFNLNGNSALSLTEQDRRMLAGLEGEAPKVAVEIIIALARLQRTHELISVSRVHIDGCIYADPALLTFAERMVALGARVKVPTTLNAISVEYDNWRQQGVDEAFGNAASKLADSYVSMGGATKLYVCALLVRNIPKAG